MVAIEMWSGKDGTLQKNFTNSHFGDDVKCGSSSKPPEDIQPTWKMFESDQKR